MNMRRFNAFVLFKKLFFLDTTMDIQFAKRQQFLTQLQDYQVLKKVFFLLGRQYVCKDRLT